jgi:hypothetical protein
MADAFDLDPVHAIMEMGGWSLIQQPNEVLAVIQD